MKIFKMTTSYPIGTIVQFTWGEQEFTGTVVASSSAGCTVEV